MKKTVLNVLLIAGFLLFGGLQGVVIAQTSTSAQSGNYNDGSTWVGGNVPANGNNIIIKTGHTVTLDVTGKSVHDITIEASAIFDNGNFDLGIQKTGGNPTYQNDGTHNSGSGNLLIFNGTNYTRMRGTGVSNINFIVRDYGIQPLFDCNLTINGNLQHHTTVTFGSKILIWNNEGGTITINGNIIPHVDKGITIVNDNWETYEANITVNGNADLSTFDSFSNEGTNFTNNGTFTVTGDLIISPGFGYVENYGEMTIGGDLLGGSSGDDLESLFVNEGLLKLGGNVFPAAPYLGNLAVGLNSTVEYLGNSDQTIFNPWDENWEPDGSYNNLIINNSNAITSMVSAIGATNLTIMPGSALTVGTGGSLSVSGAFTIESDATGTGSFISGSAITGNVERYIEGHNNIGNNGWHLLSSPVAAQAISSFHTAGSGNDFFKWSDADGLWINRTTAANGLNLDFEPNFVAGRGYLVAYVNTDTKTFSGSINASNASVSGLTTINGGWHLLGNHFSSAVKWNDGNWALNNVDAVAQVWVAADASYTSIVANEHIPAMNGFFVRANQTNASLTIPAVARAHNSTNWYKATENQDRIVLRAIDHEGQTAQTTIIRFDGNATSGYDTEYDSYFLPGFAPQMYSYDQQDNKYALNTLPNQSEDLTIPLGFVKNQGNHFTIALADGYQGQSLYLSDQTTNQTVDLTQGSYNFSATGNDLSRFSLHFALVGIDEMEAFVPSLHTWHANGVLHLSDSEPGLLSIYDLLGRPVFQQQLTGNGHLTLDLSLDPGVYIVQLRTSKGAKTAKINIR
jgi:hypothetical protein